MGCYTNEKNAQIVLALLKAHGVRKIVVSPGSTNIPISGSVQNDPFFEVYSCVDERSAAYMACGMSEKSGEPVAISCTGATASRNYLPGLTEAFYRKLPIIAITSFTGNDKIGNLVPQIIDRNILPNDVVNTSVQLPTVRNAQDEKYCNLLVNKALYAVRQNGGGPVHLNLPSTYSGVFDTDELSSQRGIGSLNLLDEWPNIEKKRICIFIGSHRQFSDQEVSAIETFCEKFDAFVACDHTSSYSGKYRIQTALVSSNFRRGTERWQSLLPDLVFHIGEISGDYYGSRIVHECPEVWRISEDGAIRDLGGKLSYVFQGKLNDFLNNFDKGGACKGYYQSWKVADESLRSKIPDLPYSNVWIASQLTEKLDNVSHIYLGILNSLRSWNFFKTPERVKCSSNVGGFGIDGCISTLIGGALVTPNEISLAVLGDLAFFYDMNSIGNRHIPANVKIVLVNNGCGVEFNNSSHIASKYKGGANKLMAAAGHFNSGDSGSENILPLAQRRDRSLAKVWCEANGFDYFQVSSKVEFGRHLSEFLMSVENKPMIMECFTEVKHESMALERITAVDPSGYDRLVTTAKKILPPSLKVKARDVAKRFGK